MFSPPIALCLFVGLAYGLYRLGGALAAEGDERPGKRQLYACGEDMSPPRTRLGYHAFFRLALMFGILHLAGMVASTLFAGGRVPWMGTAYLAGIGIGMFVLNQGEA